MGETEFPHELPSARENLSQLPAMPIRGSSSPLRRYPVSTH